MAVHITTDMLSKFNKQNYTKKRCTDLKTKKKRRDFQQESQEPSDQTISLDPPIYYGQKDLSVTMII